MMKTAMIKMMGKKTKPTQYVVGGVVAVIILGAWISIPLMSSSSLDSPAGSGNMFKTKTADVSSLGNDIPSEGGAPGYSLSGEMLSNPATSGENIAASLFQSGPDEAGSDESGLDSVEVPPDSASADVAAPPSYDSGSDASYGDSESSAGGGKLSAMASLSGGNANSVTTGGKYEKPFGTGSDKADLVPISEQSLKNKNMSAAEKRKAMVAMLQNADKKSSRAARAANFDAAGSGASSAFEKIAGGAGNSNLDSGVERGAVNSGLALGAAAQNLKANDPSLNKNASTIPEPKAAAKDDSEEADKAMKKMLLEMLMSNVLGPMFSSMASGLFGGAPKVPEVAPTK
ncbi:MAG: hypothetical protein A2270_01950 [Elusimicrobia bacterium RIFOXYA12_FULL_51_18]|nr:MAG: hypothetical protein A2270_01950 [Elusimicrobia bacterium RIFOXYA12_FULL_51_18]OGS32500.1 MAG: hypothetical protein A2218_03720 [Elusimicrobia bacterium RIFOXYA2_FULL_53_38]